MMKHAVTFGYKAQRKLRRKLRKRFTPALIQRDLDELQRALKGYEPKSLLLNYTDLVSSAWPDSIEEWLDDDERSSVVGKADDAVAHRFDLLGSGLVDTGHPIDWHRDLKTGFRWPENAHHLTIAWDAVPPGTDIKMPWELSRCQHFITLALAWRSTGNPRYYEAFKSQTADWIRSNPCGFGVNWVCAMDVAIRAVNWLTATSLFRNAAKGDVDSDFYRNLTESIWLHGCHIRRNLEWQGPCSGPQANHFLADICGLFGLGMLFGGTRRGDSWTQFARTWLEREILGQVFEDGSNYETSTSYHRLSFEMFAWAAMIARVSGNPLSPRYHARLVNMSDFVAAYTSPSGRAAQFGDNDGGRFLMSGIGDPADHRYLGHECEGFGNRANRNLIGGLPGERGRTPPYRFPDGGYAFASLGNGWIGVRAGIVSHGGAHAHADQLHFVLAVAGRDVVVDPGTGVYSADVEKRNAYRNSAAHNAPSLNGWEANRFSDGMRGLFRMTDDTRTIVDRWAQGPLAVEFKGRHFGFEQMRPGCVCERNLKLEAGSLQVTDRLTRLEKGDRLAWFFRLAPGIDVRLRDGGADLNANDVTIHLDTGNEIRMQVTEEPISPTYGIELPSRALVLRTIVEQMGEFTQRLTFRWTEN